MTRHRAATSPRRAADTAADAGELSRSPGRSHGFAGLGFGILALAALVLIVVRLVDFETFGRIVAGARPPWLVAAVALQGTTYVSVAYGWSLVFRRAGWSCPLRRLIPIALSKLFADQVLPTGGMGGNVLLVDRLTRIGCPRGVAVAALLVSMIGFYAIYALLAVAMLLLLWLHHHATPLLVGLVTTFLLVALAIPSLALWLRSRGSRLLPPRVEAFPPIANLLHILSEAPRPLLVDRGLIAKVALCNGLVFLADAGTLMLCLWALGQPAGYATAFIAQISASMAVTLAPLPLGLGSFEASCTAMLSLLGIPLAAALAATLLLRGMTLWLPLLPGLLLMRRTPRTSPTRRRRNARDSTYRHENDPSLSSGVRTRKEIPMPGVVVPIESARFSHVGRSGRAPRIALLGNFLPRLCGIATFTTHVHTAMRIRFPELHVPVYAMVDPGEDYSFPEAVVGTIRQEEPIDYLRAARSMEADDIDLLWVQHEFGIFGGPAGSRLLDLLDAVSFPVAVTLHTVLDRPNDEQRHVMDRLIARAALLIVMAKRARTILVEDYGVPPDKIAVIPHGVPDRPFRSPSLVRYTAGLENRKTILTFGLLAPGKGIEAMIRAMPAILAQSGDALYRIAGATHPHLVAREGEAYRERLKALAVEFGVADHVRWDEGFLAEDDLIEHIAAADVYVTPYLGAEQITSGALAYAAGLGKAIVSTPYVHATELLADGHGILVDFGDVAALGEAVGGLLANDAGRERMARRNYLAGRRATWNRLVERAMRALQASLPTMKPIGTHAAAQFIAARTASIDTVAKPVKESAIPYGNSRLPLWMSPPQL